MFMGTLHSLSRGEISLKGTLLGKQVMKRKRKSKTFSVELTYLKQEARLGKSKIEWRNT